MTHALHPLAEDYLDRLDRAAAHLPRARRRELADEIEAHILEALSPEPSEAEVRNALERLGTPEEIVDAEAPGPAVPAPLRPRMTGQEWAAVVLLPLGGFLLGIGWFIGVIALWSSRAWSTLDKVIGTLVLPGGLATTMALWSTYGLGESGESGCREVAPGSIVCGGGGSSTVQFVLLFAVTLLPVATAIFLARSADLNRPG